MRGSDQTSGSLFSYVDLEERVPARASAAHDHARSSNEVLASLDAGFRAALRGHGAAVDRAGAAAAGLAAAGVLLGALRAAADGADRLQPAVPLVRRARHRRCRLGPFDVLEEPRPAAGRGRGGEVPGGGAAPPQGQALPVGRSLLGGRHAGRGLGQLEELPCQGRLGRAAGARTQRRARFPRRKAHQRHARERPPTPRPSSIAKATASRPSSTSWGTR